MTKQQLNQAINTLLECEHDFTVQRTCSRITLSIYQPKVDTLVKLDSIVRCKDHNQSYLNNHLLLHYDLLTD